MAIDFNKLVNESKAASEGYAAATGGQREGAPEYPILYPHQAGTIVFRLLPNNKSNTVQRLITRHKIPDPSNQYGSKNVICSNAHYSESCPICKAVKNAITICGKECDAFKKFGYKARGIAYATIISIGPEYTDVKPGDTVLFMYPKSVYAEISNQIVNNASNLEYVFNRNEGCTFILETKKSGTFPEYSVKLNVGFNGPVMAKVKNTQEEYDAFLESLPSLNDSIVPSVMPEDLYKQAIEAADLINVRYGCTSEAVSTVNNTNGQALSDTFRKNTIDIVDTTPEVNWTTPTQTQATPTWNVPTPAPANNTPGGAPSCFGNHDDSSNKCIMCPFEPNCLGIM